MKWRSVVLFSKYLLTVLELDASWVCSLTNNEITFSWLKSLLFSCCCSLSKDSIAPSSKIIEDSFVFCVRRFESLILLDTNGFFSVVWNEKRLSSSLLFSFHSSSFTELKYRLFAFSFRRELPSVGWFSKLELCCFLRDISFKCWLRQLSSLGVNKFLVQAVFELEYRELTTAGDWSWTSKFFPLLILVIDLVIISFGADLNSSLFKLILIFFSSICSLSNLSNKFTLRFLSKSQRLFSSLAW